MEYKTKQRQLIIDFFEHNQDEFLSAKELEKQLTFISKATMYRVLDKLESDGLINKLFDDEAGNFIYQYVAKNDCAHHLHMKCNKCGKILHLENVTIGGGMEVDYKHSLIYGVCNNCLKEI